MLDRDRQILAFEESWHGAAAAKDEAVAVRLGLSPARYQQRLLRLLGDHEAEAMFPQLVHRLRRLELGRSDARRGRAAATSRLLKVSSR